MTLPLSGNALSLEVLLEPIDPGQPCGPSLRYDPDYDRLRELRREDDSSLPTGVWQAEAKRADWAAVEQLASELLQRRSKDLMLAAWLGEAWLQRGGLGGLQRALVLLAELCERYPRRCIRKPRTATSRGGCRPSTGCCAAMPSCCTRACR